MRRRVFNSIMIVAAGLHLIAIASAAPQQALSPSQTLVYTKLTHELISPCCWREPIAIHRSEESLQMLAEVEQLVAAGRSEEEIKAFYIARYGERILADPPGHERTWLYYTPVMLFVILLVLAAFRLRSLVRTPARQVGSSTPELIARVRKETENGWT